MKRPCPENDLKLPEMSLEMGDKILEPAELDHMNSKL